MSTRTSYLPESHDGTVQLALLPVVHPDSGVIDRTLSIQERFEQFHTLNPWVYRSFETLTHDWLERGHGRIGIGMLTEVLRWQYGRQTVGDDFKLNNNFRSRYVRLLMAEHPEWSDVFETRTLRA